MVSVCPGSKDTLLNHPGTRCFPSDQSEAQGWYLPSLFSVHPANRWHVNLWRTLPPFQWSFHLPWQRHVSNGYLALREYHKNRIHQVQGHLTFTFPPLPLLQMNNWSARRTVLEMELRFLCNKREHRSTKAESPWQHMAMMYASLLHLR